MRILIADPQPKVRFALRVLLEQQRGLEVVGEAGVEVPGHQPADVPALLCAQAHERTGHVGAEGEPHGPHRDVPFHHPVLNQRFNNVGFKGRTARIVDIV